MDTGSCPMDTGRVRASMQAINRGAWLTCNSSLGKPPLSHFTYPPPPSQPTSTTIIHHPS
ncbi:hypothetical protein HanPI659440_Chr05g0198451 [Helianthus annuus]|nr:hypothetical protein HanPI659440_Chr05g0198451 [Helianthus annuus]